MMIVFAHQRIQPETRNGWQFLWLHPDEKIFIEIVQFSEHLDQALSDFRILLKNRFFVILYLDNRAGNFSDRKAHCSRFYKQEALQMGSFTVRQFY